MQLSKLDDKPSSNTDTKVVMDVELLDTLMAHRGAARPGDQAVRFGLNRTHYLDLRSGRCTASLATALRIASEAGTTVEKLWSRAA